MEFTIYHESSTWRDGRKKRIATFVRVLAYLMIALALNWAVLTITEGIYLLTVATLVSALLGVVVIYLIRKNRIMSAKIVLLLTAVIYYLIATIFASGYGINNGTAHFGFIPIALVSYFLLYDLKIYREVVTLISLVLFYVFHFGYGPFYPMIILYGDQLERIHQLDVAITLIAIFIVTRQFVIEITKSEDALAITADRLEGLVESMLPKNVADRMRTEGKTFADEFHSCSVLFADIADFTHWSESHTPNEIVEKLNIIFSCFDDAVESSGLTKIKTSGDSYMVASGIPEFRTDHAVVLTRLALQLHKIASEYEDFNFRIGINSGSAVAGVIGKKIFTYDLWGDMVNTASRLEHSGTIGKVNVSEATYELIKDHFHCSYRGKIHVKSKGDMDMYFVEGEK